jgi:hypothetical protein
MILTKKNKKRKNNKIKKHKILDKIHFMDISGKIRIKRKSLKTIY